MESMRDESSLLFQLSFEDILAEPEGAHSLDFAWRLAFRVFGAVKSGVYKLLALIVAVPLAVLWGVLFALLTVLNVWACVPAARALAIPGTWVAKVPSLLPAPFYWLLLRDESWMGWAS